MFTVGLGKMMENIKKDETHTMSKCHERRRNQKGRWKFHPQGVKRPVRSIGGLGEETREK